MCVKFFLKLGKIVIRVEKGLGFRDYVLVRLVLYRLFLIGLLLVEL